MARQPWLQLCNQHIDLHGLQDEAAILHAFGKGRPHHVAPLPFPALRDKASNMRNLVADEIVARLCKEVDRGQAENFSRRFLGVMKLLDASHAREAASLLQVGLVFRMKEILVSEGPLALRVRAVSDFYYSNGALLAHKGKLSNQRRIEDIIPALPWTDVAPGLQWARIQETGHRGPMHINILRCRGVRLEMMDCRAHPQLSFPQLVQQNRAAAGVSGGFFLYSEPDIALPSRRTDPVGLLMRNGTLLNPPVFKRASLLTGPVGEAQIRRMGMDETVLFIGETALPLRRHNNGSGLGTEPCVFNRAHSDHSPPHDGLSIAWNAGKVVQVSPQGEALPIPLAGFVLTVPKQIARKLGKGPQAEELLRVELIGTGIQNAMAGGPMLLTDGETCIDREAEDFRLGAPPITFSQDETFDQNLLPRMAVGLTQDGALVFAAVDGRNVREALGFTLRDTARLMKALGCTEAMNLDGGSSKRMAVGGRAVDLASTEVKTGEDDNQRVRPVHSAILIHPARQR